MTEINLEQVKKLAEQLSPEDRLQLFHYLSDLPDSGIQSGNLSQPPLTLKGVPENNEEIDNTDNFVLIYTETDVAVLLRGKVIFQVFYHPENFRESHLKIRSWQNAPPSESVKSRIHSELAQHGIERTEEEIIEICRQASTRLFEAETYRLSNEISARLPHMTWLLIDATIEIIKIAVRNSFAEQTGQQEKKTKLDEIEKRLNPYWRQIKRDHLDISPGGSRTRKSEFIWDSEKSLNFYKTIEDLPRIAKKPMWEFAQEQLRDNDYKFDTVTWLMSHPAFADVPDGLLKEAAKVWREFDEKWESLPDKSKPLAFAFRNACHKLGYPENAYGTLRNKYYEGKRAFESKE